MFLPSDLKSRLERVARRRRKFQLWSRLALCWGAAAAGGLLLIVLERQTGWGSALALPGLALGAVAAAVLVAFRGGVA